MKSIFNKLVGDRKQEGKITVGSHHLHIVKQIAEGGFSYVFLCKEKENHKLYALKRVLTHDDEELEHVLQEVAVMKKLSESDHKNIVKFYDYTVMASTKQADTSEVYILMEYCGGGHLVDIMNAKPQRFPEQDILSIFYDICQAVSLMHSQDPPMAHRDLKVENVLLDEHSGVFKLCDFGSVTTKTLRPSNKHEISAAEEEIQKHTTLQYRAPEMIDLYQHRLISEKVDIWALGCVLYKLAFYKTPFEDAGTLQILNVDYTIPADSKYSPNLHNLIRKMLNADPDARPDIFDVMEEVCKLRNIPPPPRIKHASRNSGNLQSPPEIHPPGSPVHVHAPPVHPSTPTHTTPVHTPVHTPTHSPKPSPKPSPMNSPAQLHLHSHQNHQNLEPSHNNGNHTHAALNIQNNHLAPPSNHLAPPSNHLAPQSATTLQTSQSAHNVHSGISPRSPAAAERSAHRRTHSNTDRSQLPAIEQLRARPALTSSSPNIAPPSSSSPFIVPTPALVPPPSSTSPFITPSPSSAASSPFLAPPSATAHLQVQGRRRGQSDDAANPFASPFISPAVSPLITPAPLVLMGDANGHTGGAEKVERGEAEGDIEAQVKTVTDTSKSVPDQVTVNHIIATTHEMHTGTPILDVVMRQSLTNAFVCLKAIYLVHRLMQDGHPQVFADLVGSAQLYNNLYLGWTKHADRAPEMAPVLALHSQAVYRKIVYHQKNPGLDGKLKSTTVVPTAQLMSSLLEALSDIVKIQPHISSAIFVCPEDLLAYALSPLVIEAVNIYHFLNRHLSPEALSHAPSTSPPPPAQFSSSFSSQLSELQQFFSFLPQTLPTLCSLVSFPSIAVPENPFGTDPFNPFGAPSKFDPFFSPPEEREPLPRDPLPKSPLQSPLSKTHSGAFPRTSSLTVIPPTVYSNSPPHSPSHSPSPIPRFSLTPATSGTPLQRSTSLLTASLYMTRNFDDMSLDPPSLTSSARPVAVNSVDMSPNPSPASAPVTRNFDPPALTTTARSSERPPLASDFLPPSYKAAPNLVALGKRTMSEVNLRGHIPAPQISMQQQMQQQQLQQQLQQVQLQQQQMQQQNDMIPKPLQSAFVTPLNPANFSNSNSSGNSSTSSSGSFSNSASMDHGLLAGNLSPRVKSRDMPTLNQPPAARRSNAHRRAQSNTADDIVRRLDPNQLNNIRTAALMNQGSPSKRN